MALLARTQVTVKCVCMRENKGVIETAVCEYRLKAEIKQIVNNDCMERTKSGGEYFKLLLRGSTLKQTFRSFRSFQSYLFRDR